MMKRLRLLLMLLAVGMLCVTVTHAQGESLPEHPEILWDVWGVPHIFSPDYEGLFYGFGWAQMQNHADLILKLYGEARGRAAEYWGADYLQGDILAHTLGIPQEAAAGYDLLSDEFKTYVEAFAAGINAYAEAHLDSIGEQWRLVLPVTPLDVIANGIRVLRYTFTGGEGIRYALNTGDLPQGLGSNAWAIGPERSASGHAMLVANPHQPWSGLGQLTEAHFVGPDMNLYGATLVGSPVLTFGFDDNHAWTHTVNTRDGYDLYQLTLADGGYVYDGEIVPFDQREVELRVNQGDGSYRMETFTAYESVHGSVLVTRGDGTALALRVVGENSILAAQQWWQMGRATNLEEFEDALRLLYIPMFTIMYADRDGNILHVFNEQVPIRDEGDWAFWNNTNRLDNTPPALIPGDDSRYVWTEYHPYEDLPRVLNPESGWLQNANEPPWTTTLPLALDPDAYPAYMLPPAYVLPRSVSSMRLINADDSITYDELVTYKFDTYMELANFALDDLLEAARGSDSAIVQQAVAVLEAWDRRADADSRGAVLFAAWANAFVSIESFVTPWDLNDPLNTPRGLIDPEGAVAALEMVATELNRLRLIGAGMDVPWGDVFRLRVGEYDLPANGAEDLLGTFSVVTATQDADLRFRPIAGDTFVAVIEFSDPIRLEVLLTHGNASQPDSPHLGDQLPLFADKSLRPAWRTRAEIEANLRDRVVFDQR